MKIKMINQLINHSVAGSDDCSCDAGCDLVVGGELWADGGDAGPSAFSRAARALLDGWHGVKSVGILCLPECICTCFIFLVFLLRRGSSGAAAVVAHAWT